eukprot:scaffold84668_cov64-Phaeocystis_antarctica.AAC.4
MCALLLTQIGVFIRQTQYGEPSSLDQAGPSSHYACWEAAAGRSHPFCTLPQGHMGEHELPQLGRTRN